MAFYSLFICFLICIAPIPTFAGEKDRYEVTATPLSSSQPIGGEATHISRKEIETYQEIFLKDALPYAPSVILTSSGPLGRQVDFSIRGAQSSQNLVLIDGVSINDPASGGTTDLSQYLNADLEQIEVLPGPQSLAYGPGALGGVVRLIPKKGEGKPSLKAHGEGGSFQTKYGALTGQGEEGPLQFSATAAGFKRGPDSFRNPLHGNRQADRFRNGTLSSRVGAIATDNWEIEGLIRYAENKVQFDNPKFVPEKGVWLPFVARNFSNAKTLVSSIDNKWGGDTWDHSLKLSYMRSQRSTSSPRFHNETVGEHPFISQQSEFKINPCHTLLGGVDGGQERAKDGQLHRRFHGGIFLIHDFKPFETTNLTGGVRGDHYQSLGSRITFNVGVDQNITQTTRLRSSYGTNFKPPVLSDLFQKGPLQKPNPFLKPEKSQNFEAGVDQSFCANKGKARLTGFLTWIERITLSRRLPDGKWQRFNGGRRKTKGLEGALAFLPIKSLTLTTALTLTHSRDHPHKGRAPFIPLFKGAGGIHWQALSELSFFLQGYGMTSRKDSITKRTLAPYGVIHIGGRYNIHQHAGIFWRFENLTNKRYEEVFGYGTRGRAFFVGLEAQT